MPDTPTASTPLRWTNGHAVAAARADAGITQTELAARVGVTKVAISHIEAGRSEASARMLSLIADALGIDAGPLIRPASAMIAAGVVPDPRAAA